MTGKSFPAGCNSYICPECGPVKARKLGKYIRKYIERWKVIRFWTFTLSNNYCKDEQEHYRQLQEVWRRWLTYMRRSKSLRKKQRNFRFIKVIEVHKSGYIHIHCFIDQYIPWEIANTTWENLSGAVLNTHYKPGTAIVKGIKQAGFVAYYVAKYVAKSSHHLHMYVRRWSTSYGVKIIPERITSGEWIVIRFNSKMHDDLQKAGCYEPTYLEVQGNNFTAGTDPPEKELSLRLFSDDTLKSLECNSLRGHYG